MLDMARAREVFEASEDFTVGTRGGVRDPRPATRCDWPSASRSCATPPQADEVLRESVAGELIESEIEIRSGRGVDLRRRRGAPARGPRAPVPRWPPASGALLAATGTHPWSPWQEQRIIDTEHYHRVEDGLKYVAWRNNTFSLHVHVGVRGADRAIAVCDRLRPILPELLALSANSPFLDGRDSGLHSARTPDLHQELPPLRDPRRRSAASTPTPTTSTSWCARTRSSSTPSCGGACGPHHCFGTVEVRICDAQSAPRSPPRWPG